jgi:hypothetical protein
MSHRYEKLPLVGCRSLSLKLLNAALKVSVPDVDASSSVDKPSHPVIVQFNGIEGELQPVDTKIPLNI